MSSTGIPADDDTLLRPAEPPPPAGPGADDQTALRPAPGPPRVPDDDETVLMPPPSAAAAESSLSAAEPGPALDPMDPVAVPPQPGDTESPLEAGVPAAPASGAGFAGKLKRLGSESLIYGLSSIVGRLLSYVLVWPYAAVFTTAQNGVQSAVYTYAPILSIVFLLGMDVAYMRSAAAVKDAGPEARQRAFSMSFGTVAGAGALALLLGQLAAPWLADAFALPVGAFRYLLAIVYTDSLIAVPYAHLRMAGRAKRYAVLRLLFVAVSLGLNLVLIMFLHWGLAGIFAANLAANLAVLALFAGDIRQLFRPATLRGAVWKPLWRFALPIMPAMLAVMIVENGDRMVLNWLPDNAAQAAYGMTSKDVLGIYNFNYKLGVAMLLVVQMFRLAWTPFFLQHGKQSDAPQLFSRVLTVVMLVCAAAFLGLAILIPSLAGIPLIHGIPSEESYWLGLPIVPVILLGYLLSGMYAIVTAGLYIEKRTGVLPWIAGAGAVINIAVCLVAARHSMVAVAWATPASYALMSVLGAWQSSRVYPVPFEWMRLAHLGAIVAALFAVDQWLAQHGWVPTEARTLAAKLALLLGFPALLLATRFFRAGEWDVMKRLVRRG